MWNKNVFILACFGVFSSITSPAFGDSSNTPQEPVEFRCGPGKIIRGNPVTYNLNSICGGDVYLSADPNVFMTSDFPLDIAVYLRDELDVETAHLTRQIASIPAGGNITSFIPTGNLAIDDGGCDNRGATVYFKLTSTSNTDIAFEGSVKRYILCDCSAVDLMLSTDLGAGAQLPDIFLDDINPNLKAAMMAQEINLEMFASNVGGTLPTFEASTDVTGGALPFVFFAAAFIRDNNYGMILPHGGCTGNHDVPEILGEDITVAYKQFNSNNTLFLALEVAEADLASLGSSLFTSVKMDEKLELCGEHMLVLKLDTMNTCWNEVNKCNNFLTMRIHSSRPCDAVPPRCEVIRNGWTVGDARGIYRGTDSSTMMPRVSMFDHDDYGWREIYDSFDDMPLARAYGRMKLLKHVIDEKVATGSAVCSMALSDMLENMEGNTEADTDTTTETLTDAVVEAKNNIEALRDGGDAVTIKQAMESALHTLETELSASVDFPTKLEYVIGARALKSVLSEAEHRINSGTDGPDGNACELLPEQLEESRWIHRENPAYAMDHVISLASNVTAALISKPEMPCLEKMLKRFITYANEAETTDSPNADFLFDSDDIKEEEDLYHCGKANKCIQKIHRVCDAEHMPNMVDIHEYSEDICKLHIMKATAKSQYKLVGVDLRGQFKERDAREGKQCNRDPLKPQTGLGPLWKTTTDTDTQNTYFEKGVITLDKNYIAWRKVAICSCQPCKTHTESWSTTGEQDGMMKKRRRK